MQNDISKKDKKKVKDLTMNEKQDILNELNRLSSRPDDEYLHQTDK